VDVIIISQAFSSARRIDEFIEAISSCDAFLLSHTLESQAFYFEFKKETNEEGQDRYMHMHMRGTK
jgi:hypothetical protein